MVISYLLPQWRQLFYLLDFMELIADATKIKDSRSGNSTFSQVHTVAAIKASLGDAPQLKVQI
jgi:hypothetical protein